MKDKNKILGEILKERRNELGYSLRKVADVIGISHTELSNIEDGERKSLNLNLIVNLCEYLNISFKDTLDKSRFFEEQKKYRVLFRRTSENCVEIESNNLNKVVELITDVNFDLDEILPNINDEVEWNVTDNNNYDSDYEEMICRFCTE